MLVKDASEKDISELRKRLKEQQKQRILERDVKQVIDIVNRHSEKLREKKRTGGPGEN